MTLLQFAMVSVWHNDAGVAVYTYVIVTVTTGDIVKDGAGVNVNVGDNTGDRVAVGVVVIVQIGVNVGDNTTQPYI